MAMALGVGAACDCSVITHGSQIIPGGETVTPGRCGSLSTCITWGACGIALQPLHHAMESGPLPLHTSVACMQHVFGFQYYLVPVMMPAVTVTAPPHMPMLAPRHCCGRPRCSQASV
jgi:hypothetical protein